MSAINFEYTFRDLNQGAKTQEIRTPFKPPVNPENFGVVEVQDDKVLSLTEKPIEFISNKAVIGVYIFDDTFNNHFENITKSKRGEYEILDIVKSYGLENINHNSITCPKVP